MAHPWICTFGLSAILAAAGLGCGSSNAGNTKSRPTQTLNHASPFGNSTYLQNRQKSLARQVGVSAASSNAETGSRYVHDTGKSRVRTASPYQKPAAAPLLGAGASNLTYRRKSLPNHPRQMTNSAIDNASKITTGVVQ